METTSATSSVTRTIVAALGGGSGIDMIGLANSLAEAQFAGRTNRLTTRAETIDRQISAASDIKGMLLSLATSLGERVREGDLSPQPQIANAAVAKASLSGSRQPVGSYTLEVTQIAASQTLAAPPYAAATDPTGSGTLTLRFGTIAGTGFTEDLAHAAVPITIASGATLNDVAAAINGARAGVSAYVSMTTAGARLVLKGQEGAANAFILEAAETLGEEGLANLAWTPAAAPAQRLTSAADAAFRVDGLAMTAPGNTVSDAIPGVTLALTTTNSGAPTKVTFANPATAITSAMQDLTAALNEVGAAVNAATDPKSGDLARDSGAQALRRSLAGLAGTVIMPLSPESAPRTLADLGLSTQRDGSFLLDTKRLAATLAADPNGAAAMFTTGLNGVYATIDATVRRANVAGDPGSLAGSIARYAGQKTRITADQTKLTEQMEALRTRMVQRFAVTDSRVGASKSTLSFLQGQIAAWNAKAG